MSRQLSMKRQSICDTRKLSASGPGLERREFVHRDKLCSQSGRRRTRTPRQSSNQRITLPSSPFPLPQILIAELSCKSHNSIQGLFDGVGGGCVREPHPPIIAESRARNERDAALSDEPRAEVGSRDLPEGIHSEEKVERTERIDELDAGEILPEPGHHQVPAFAEFAHHAVDVLLDAFITARGGRP